MRHGWLHMKMLWLLSTAGNQINATNFLQHGQSFGRYEIYSLYACLQFCRHALEVSLSWCLLLSCSPICLQKPLQLPGEAMVRPHLSGTRCADVLCLGPHTYALCIAGASTAVAEAEAIASSSGRKLLDIA